MINGLQALHKLDNSLRTVRHGVNQVDKELNHAAVSLQKNRQIQAKLLARLARVRLKELESGDLAGHIEVADETALKILSNREAAFENLQASIDASNQALEKLESQRDELVSARVNCAQAVIDCEHDLQESLENSADYQAQLEEAREQDLIAEEAEQKARFALKDRAEKGQPFEDDPLFNYLWRRSFGTPDYKGGVLTRFLDSWVAKVCDYESYRVNYWTLLKIPERLRNHADAALVEAESELKKLTALEADAANKSGLPDLQDKLRTAQAQVDALDDDIVEAEEKLDAQLRERANFAQAKDVHMTQSLQVLEQALGAKSPAQLEYSAQQTQTDQDDFDARQLAELRELQKDLQDELLDHRKLHDAKLGRLRELETVRRNFKNHRFDDLRSGFGNEELISTLLGQFLSGLISGNDLWRTMKRHQRHRDVGAWPDFGSGGIRYPGSRRRTSRIPRTRSPWHVSQGRGNSGGGFRLPRSGGWTSRGGGRRGGGGGGFRTGGGF